MMIVAMAAALVASFWTPSAWIQINAGAAGHSNLNGLQTSAEPKMRFGSFRGSQTSRPSSSSWGMPFLGLMGIGLVRLARSQSSRSARACQAQEVPLELQAPEEPSDVETWEVSRSEVLRGAGVAAALATADPAEAKGVKPEWVQFDLQTGEILYDIDFDPLDDQHGFIVGARGLFYETKDGGTRWVSRSFANLGKTEDIQYRFQGISVRGDDVWIIGKPPLLLHSRDGGKSWKKVPVSRKLPGQPKLITALGPGKAEIATNAGAIYITENNGKSWKSVVQETVDATLNRVTASGASGGATYFTGSLKNITRNRNGGYLAVAQRGNFYLSFNPGDQRWIPHGRLSARRIQAMGFREAVNTDPMVGAWMSLNGGFMTMCSKEGFDELGSDTKELFDDSKIRSGGIGLIDIAFRTPEEAWATGGSGVIYRSLDGGKKWDFDPSGVNLPCNLYNVKFFRKGTVGYMIGNAGILLRREFASSASDTAEKEAARAAASA